MSELLPCPLCESNRVEGFFVRDGWAVGCRDCGVNVAAHNPEARRKVAEAWNTRPHRESSKAKQKVGA